VADDVRTGFVSPEAARRDYGVVVAADGSVDRDATATLRGKASE
jgi:N-methylhydantoinase B